MSSITLPPEWASQSSILLTWPHEDTDWADNLSKVEETFFSIANTICKYQNVIISCESFDQLEGIANRLSEAEIPPDKVDLYCIPSNDSWARDHGPITILDSGNPVILDFQFNAWGGKFPCEKDDLITSTLYELGAFEFASFHQVPIILEGGSIESDGKGTILTTSQCLLTSTRNPDFDKSKATYQSRCYVPPCGHLTKLHYGKQRKVKTVSLSILFA